MDVTKLMKLKAKVLMKLMKVKVPDLQMLVYCIFILPI